jgi:muramoyltetrapeptide carboxypeptidase
VQDVVTDCLLGLGVPVVGGFPVGHESTSNAVWLGSTAVLDAETGVLETGC